MQREREEDYEQLAKKLFRWPMKAATREATKTLLKGCLEDDLPVPEHEVLFEEEVDAEEVYLNWNVLVENEPRRAGVFVNQKGAYRGHRFCPTSSSFAEAGRFFPLTTANDVVDFVKELFQ